MKSCKYINNINYIVVHGWMINELDLKGNELLLYAIIFGFSQLEGQVFSGSLLYMAEWTNSTKPSVIKNLNSLLEKDLIGKNEKVINGVKLVEYYAKKFTGGSKETLPPTSKETLPNNINKKDNNIYINILKENFEETVIETFNKFIEMRKSIKKPMTEYAVKLMINKLKKLSPIPREQVAILEQSILNNWQDIYDIVQKNQYKYNNQYNSFKDIANNFTNNSNKQLSQDEIEDINQKEYDF